MIQSVSFTSAAFKYFAEGYLCFLASASAIRFLRILRKYVPKNKCFHLKKKSNVSFNKKVIFVFRMIFKLYFITQQIIYCIIHRCLYSLFILLLFSYIIFQKQNIETMLTLPYSYKWQKFNYKMNEKRSQEYHSMDPEYVNGQINSFILEFLFRQLCHLISAPSRKS